MTRIHEPNLDTRIAFLHTKCLDQMFMVKCLGEVDPLAERESIEKYIPLPEYGICLVQYVVRPEHNNLHTS